MPCLLIYIVCMYSCHVLKQRHPSLTGHYFLQVRKTIAQVLLEFFGLCDTCVAVVAWLVLLFLVSAGWVAGVLVACRLSL